MLKRIRNACLSFAKKLMGQPFLGKAFHTLAATALPFVEKHLSNNGGTWKIFRRLSQSKGGLI